MKKYSSNHHLKMKCFAITLSSLIALSKADAQAQNDTLRLYANKQVINWKDKKLVLNGENLRLYEVDNSDSITNSIILSRVNAKDLIEVFVVIKYQNTLRDTAEYYIVINGEKHFVDLTCYLEFRSNADSQKYFLEASGAVLSKYFHCDHYSHSSHYSHFSSSPTP